MPNLIVGNKTVFVIETVHLFYTELFKVELFLLFNWV